MAKTLFDDLCCPYCREGFEKETYGNSLHSSVLRCSCYEYPVLEGIPLIIKRCDIPPTVSLIKKGKAQEALIYQLEVSFSFFQRLFNKTKKYRLPLIDGIKNRIIIGIKKRKANMLLSLLKEKDYYKIVSFLKAGQWGDYIKYRFVSESFFVGKQLLLQLYAAEHAGSNRKKQKAKKPILDHLCGAGHYTFVLGRLFPSRGIIATDQSLLNLMIAKSIFNPDAFYICLDGNYPLPLKDNAVSIFFNSDSFHYLKDEGKQRLCIKEAERVVEKDGEGIFLHLHLKNSGNKGEGNAHTVMGYREMLGPFAQKTMDEQTIMDIYHPEIKMEGASIILFGKKNKKYPFIWIKTGRMKEYKVMGSCSLSLSPLYRKMNKGGSMHIYKVHPLIFYRDGDKKTKILKDVGEYGGIMAEKDEILVREGVFFESPFTSHVKKETKGV